MSLSVSPSLMDAMSKVDEGYSGGSEETRSISDSDSNMQLDVQDPLGDKPSVDSILSTVLSLPPEERSALISSLLLHLPESEKYGTCFIWSTTPIHTLLLTNHRNGLCLPALAAHLFHRIHRRAPQPPAPPRSCRPPASRDHFTDLPPSQSLRPPEMFHSLETMARKSARRQSLENLLRP